MIQNHGPDDLYVHDVDPATADQGTLVPSGSALAVGGGADFFAISDGTSDTRILGRGESFSSAAGLALVASTGIDGFVLENATPTILSWTAPDDGKLHRVLLVATQDVTQAMTGGLIRARFSMPNGNSNDTVQVSDGQDSTGYNYNLYLATFPMIIEPGSTFTLGQESALTAGASTFWAELWAS
jgi:hypothetical protein